MDPALVVVIMLAGALISGAIASSKKLDVTLYAVCGAFFPLITIIVALVKSPRQVVQS